MTLLLGLLPSTLQWIVNAQLGAQFFQYSGSDPKVGAATRMLVVVLASPSLNSSGPSLFNCYMDVVAKQKVPETMQESIQVCNSSGMVLICLYYCFISWFVYHRVSGRIRQLPPASGCCHRRSLASLVQYAMMFCMCRHRNLIFTMNCQTRSCE